MPALDIGQKSKAGLLQMSHADHVLVVDDREVRELVATYLKQNGLRASTAADGQQMRAFLDGNRVDLVILDPVMPGITVSLSAASSGPAATGRCRSDRWA